MRTYKEIEEMFRGKNKPRIKVAPNTFLEKDEVVENLLTEFLLTLHGNRICRYGKNSFILSSSGWETKTTKDRLNRFTPFSVFSEKRVWKVQFTNQDGSLETVDFFDNMTFVKEQKGHMFIKDTRFGVV